MTKKPKLSEETPDLEDANLSISTENLFFIVAKAREFDVKDAVSEPDPGSNPTDDSDIAVLEDHPDDPVAQELTAFIRSLSEDEQIDLVALTWLGRGDGDASEWASIRQQAAEAHNARTAQYLLGMPLLGDLIEEGLDKLGVSLEAEEGRL